VSKAFLSHSHHDREMAKRLHAALTEAKKDVWADWEDIPPASVFQHDLDDGVAGCDAFVFLISPDSVKSEYCLAELERAMALNKRIVPVVHRPVDDGAMPAALSERNWIPQEGSVADDFAPCLERLITAIDTDLDWTRQHTRWGNHALEWDGNERDKSLLLRGEELERAEDWLGRAEGRSPAPSDLQRDYIRLSREEAVRSRRARFGFAGGALALLVVLGVVTLLVVANQNEKNTKIDYIRSVGAILNESTKGLNEVQAVFSELEAISKGQKKRITPVPKLAVQLREAVNQRTALGRRSAKLGAPSGLARRMRASLVQLFGLKLANIHDIQHCIPLAEGAKPRRAALAGCLKGTRGTAKAASSGRDRFLALYNELRKGAGLEPTSPVF
jgi:hypothetical protein